MLSPHYSPSSSPDSDYDPCTSPSAEHDSYFPPSPSVSPVARRLSLPADRSTASVMAKSSFVAAFQGAPLGEGWESILPSERDVTVVLTVGEEDGIGRVSLACDACRSRKLKCDGNKTSCARCTGRGTACKYSVRPPPRPRAARRRSSVSTISSPVISSPCEPCFTTKPLIRHSRISEEFEGHVEEHVYGVRAEGGGDKSIFEWEDGCAPSAVSFHGTHLAPPASRPVYLPDQLAPPLHPHSAYDASVQITYPPYYDQPTYTTSDKDYHFPTSSNYSPYIPSPTSSSFTPSTLFSHLHLEPLQADSTNSHSNLARRSSCIASFAPSSSSSSYSAGPTSSPRYAPYARRQSAPFAPVQSSAPPLEEQHYYAYVPVTAEESHTAAEALDWVVEEAVYEL